MSLDNLVPMRNSETLNRSKYIEIARIQGVSQAITQLHHDLWNKEFDAFEGENGYDADKVAQLEEIREFSRQLWKSSLDTEVFEKPNRSDF